MNAPTVTTANGDVLHVRRCRLAGRSHWHSPTCHTLTLVPEHRTVPMMVEHWGDEIAAHRRADILMNLAAEQVALGDKGHVYARSTCLACNEPMTERALMCRDCLRDLREGSDVPSPAFPPLRLVT
jgi:hypothetical protein